MALVERAAAAGYDTLLVTVDVPVAGARLRDKRNGMSIPPALTLGTVVNALPRPQWWIDFLTTEPLAFASLDRWSGTVAELLDTMFDPTRHLRGSGVDQVPVAGQGRRQGHPDPRRRAQGRRHRCRRHRAVQPRRPPTRPRSDSVPPAARGRRRGRQRHRSHAGHRHHVRRRHRRRDRPRSAVHADRPRLSLRADGRRRSRRRPGDRRSFPSRSPAPCACWASPAWRN